jgi:hypothetical protein
MYTTRYTINGVDHIWKTDNKLSGNGYITFDNKENQIYSDILDMLIYWTNIACKYDIKWFSICGTLLGAIRNNGIIPHDDDADVGILLRDYNKVKHLTDSLNSSTFYITRADVGFRIFKNNTRFPFVDIWVFGKNKQHPGRLIYACPFKNDIPTYYASIYLDREYIEEQDINKIAWVEFENIKLPIINNPQQYLVRAYGSNCLTTYVGEPIKNIHYIIDTLPFYEIMQLFFSICEYIKLDDNEQIRRHFSCCCIRVLYLLLRDFDRNPVYIHDRMKEIMLEYIGK